LGGPVTSPKIAVQSLSVRFGEAAILREVSASIDESRFLTVIGPNGAG
jgi:ABC-type branched-subunit amino acid transport system ATPase component